MPPWFIDIESATEIEAKSNGTPPAPRMAAQAWRANSPSSALHGVTRPSVEATPMNGLPRSASDRPSARRNARWGARSSPSTVMREGSFGILMFRSHSKRPRRKDASRCAGAAAAVRQRGRVAAGLSGARREDRRALRRRRAGRYLRPLHRRQAAGRARPAFRRRGSARRRLDRRHRRGGQVAARRLHAAHDVEHAHGERDADSEKALRPDARLRADHAGELLRSHHGDPPFRGGKGPEGVHRARQIEARRAELRLVWPRHAVPHGGRAFQGDGRRRHRARTPQGKRPGAHRDLGRASPDDVRRDHHHGGQRPRRKSPRPRHHRQQALLGDAGDSDPRRGRSAWLRSDPLARPDGAGGNAAADPGENKSRGQQDRERARCEGGLVQTGRGADGHDARAVRQVPARRHRQVGESGQGLRGQGRLMTQDQPRRGGWMRFAFAVITSLLSGAVAAQACPEKTLLYWQAFPAGGESDLSARHQQLVLKKKCPAIETIIQYKPGAGGGLLWMQLNQLPGDGLNIAGINSANHAAHERLDATFGIRTTYVPFKGTGDMTTAVIGGHVAGAMSYTAFAVNNKGKVRALVVAMEQRHPLLPEVPTFRELGIDGVDGAFRGIGVPKSTPAEARRRMSELWAALNADPEMKELAAKSGFELVNVGVDRMEGFMKERVRAYTEAGHRMGLGK